jgi:hypothetical protein
MVKRVQRRIELAPYTKHACFPATGPHHNICYKIAIPNIYIYTHKKNIETWGRAMALLGPHVAPPLLLGGCTRGPSSM